MNLAERITIDPDICHGKPCIRGLRYPVETILELLSSGMTPEEILSDYEDLEREDILAALSFATRLSKVKRIKLALETSHTVLLSEKALGEDWSRPEEDEAWSHLRQIL